MARKKSIIKAYKRKWRRMPKSDRIFVMKFLGAALFLLLLIILLLFFLISLVLHHTNLPDSPGVSSQKNSYGESSLQEVEISNNNSSTEKTSSDKAGTTNNSSIVKRDSKRASQLIEEQDESSEDTPPIQSEKNLIEHADVQLLARLITAETGSSSEQAQIAIASVVMNRVNSDKFPNTVFEVIYQKGQYSPTWNGSINNTPNEQALKNALFVYQNGSQIPSNVLYQSRYVQGSGIWAQIDGNYFCYE